MVRERETRRAQGKQGIWLVAVVEREEEEIVYLNEEERQQDVSGKRNSNGNTGTPARGSQGRLIGAPGKRNSCLSLRGAPL